VRAAVIATFIAIVVLQAAAPALAHDETVSTSDVTIAGDTLTWKVDVGVAGLEKVVKLPKPEAELTVPDLTTAKGTIAEYLVRGLTVTLDGLAVTPEIGAIEPRWEPSPITGQEVISRVSLALRYQAAGAIRRADCRVAFFSDLTKQHRAVITARWNGEVRQHVRLGVADLSLEAPGGPASTWSVMREFLVWGAEHIFIGYDHIAFLLALLLVATRVTELLKIVTSFTVAHSLTLLLSALQIVRFPSRLTEILIAASIVYVAIENMFLKSTRHRVWLTFAFGLVHGLGFATQLRDRLAQLPGDLLLPVISFNLGVELGQVAIVAVAFPVLLLLRRAASERRVPLLVRWGSVPILLLGLFWLVERMTA
jgi:hydrogenase/urease accessory protein HupE